MLFATWNVNSINVRLPHLLAWLRQRKPDVVCLQETKTADATFPHTALEEAGYAAVVHGQPAYNGVAVLVRHGHQLGEVHRGLVLADVDVDAAAEVDAADPNVLDPQARVVGVEVAGLHVYSVYVPNGTALKHPRCAYKRAWLRGLRDLLQQRHGRGAPVLLAGDYNVALRPEDMVDPDKWAKTVLFHPSMRAALDEVVKVGLVDVLHKHQPQGGLFTWWDYRTDGYARGSGVRIDHILATQALACRSQGAGVDHEERGKERPSDHAPVWAQFAWP